MASEHAVTPARRALTIDPPSGQTPSVLGQARRNVNSNAPTPHAVAARRALDQRRHALFTPGKLRRRSLMDQREEPLDMLRTLSRALARGSEPVATSPLDQPASASTRHHHDGDSHNLNLDDDDDDELPIDKPRLSLPLDQDDDSDLPLPRSSGLEDENYTAQSIELPRRALSEQPRLSIARVSDFFDQNSNYPIDETARHSDFFPGLLEDLEARTAAGDLTLDRIDADPTRRATFSRDSDFGLQLPAGLDEQTTFLLSEPPTELMADSTDARRSLVDTTLINDVDLTGSADAANITMEGDDGADLTQATDRLDLTLGDEGVDLTQRDEAMDFTQGDDGVGGFTQGDDGVDFTQGADGDFDLTDMNPDQPPRPARVASGRGRQKRLSKHGAEYPPLPPSMVKKVAQKFLHSSGLSNPRISADTLAALTQASDWFFEQLGDDLGAYAKHAKRKTVEESDVVTLMRRQRQIGPDMSLFSLAQKHLPRELLQDLRMSVPPPTKKRRREGPQDDEHGQDN
ncbi:hypothetical protein L249_3902 [Ophiocordyceps polyrhachis-furcata BCC 54312]|uniref:CENP-T/Histone H4 histone fold domain-containing protein n=1 Tax=Ophiocordyceps polyrhachis-furcata BCC 54312 TaxID=1330021 RepID=A0A367L582_9HYPO|nr:hypothetical protein L249_3902 [Ophiocordyceps polyrhachis-furcata BCC 54312]